MKIKDYLWVEKYRPTKLEDMILDDEVKTTFDNWVSEGQIPHLLLVGTQGSGKTTLARILVKSILSDLDSDLLMLNGSAQRGIDIVRENIEDFLKTPPIGESKIKIVFIDEFDYMTPEAQNSLRNIIETYSGTGRFLCTANYANKISPPLHSRFQTFTFQNLPKDYVSKYVKYILDTEEINYEQESVDKIIGTYYPDIRKIIGTLQSKITDKKLSDELKDIKNNETVLQNSFINMINGIKKGDVKTSSIELGKINNILSEQDIDFVEIYKSLFFNKQLSINCKINIVKYADTHLTCMDPCIHFMAMCLSVYQSEKDRMAMLIKTKGVN